MPARYKKPSKFMKKASKNLGLKFPKRITVSTNVKHKYVKAGQIGAEVKFSDTVLAPVVMGVNGTVLDAGTFLGQGVTNITRIGNKVQCKSIEIKGICGNGAVGDLVHWALVLDREPELGLIAAYADIFTMPAGQLASGFNQINNSQRFLTLASGLVTSDLLGGNAAFQHFHAYVPIDIATKYVGILAAQGSMGSNQLLFASISQNNVSTVGYACRIRYTDE